MTKLPPDASNDTIEKAERWAGPCHRGRRLETRRAQCVCPNCHIYRVLVHALHEAEQRYETMRERLSGYTRPAQADDFIDNFIDTSEIE